MNSSNKRLYLLIIIAVALVSIIASISYGYFNSDLSNRNVGNYTIVLGEDYTLSTSGGNPVNYNVSDSDMFGVSYDVEAANNTSTLNITLKNDGSQTVTCTYSFAWRWDTTGSNYTKSQGATGEQKEFTVSISGDSLNGVGQEQQVPDYNSGTLSYPQQSISANAGQSTTQQVSVNIKFYNLANVDQSGHMGNTYKGGVIIDNASCTKS